MFFARLIASTYPLSCLFLKLVFAFPIWRVPQLKKLNPWLSLMASKHCLMYSGALETLCTQQMNDNFRATETLLWNSSELAASFPGTRLLIVSCSCTDIPAISSQTKTYSLVNGRMRVGLMFIWSYSESIWLAAALKNALRCSSLHVRKRTRSWASMVRRAVRLVFDGFSGDGQNHSVSSIQEIVAAHGIEEPQIGMAG